MKNKMMLFLVLLLLFSMLLIDYSYLQEKGIQVIGIFSGNEYLALTDNDKLFYTIGLFDMWSGLTYLFTPEDYPDIKSKIENMSGSQVKAIFDKFLEEHPENWHLSAATIFAVAMWETLEKQ